MGVATPPNTATSRTAASTSEKKTTHALVVPADADVVVDGIEVTEDSVERKTGLQRPAPKLALMVEALTPTALDVTTPTPPARLHGPPATEEVVGCAAAAA